MDFKCFHTPIYVFAVYFGVFLREPTKKAEKGCLPGIYLMISAIYMYLPVQTSVYFRWDLDSSRSEIEKPQTEIAGVKRISMKMKAIYIVYSNLVRITVLHIYSFVLCTLQIFNSLINLQRIGI